MKVQEWLGEDNQLGIDIWERKYRYKDETFDEWVDRVSGGNTDIARLIREKKFLFGGRILANRGLQKDGRKISLSNCFPKGTEVFTSEGYKSIENIKKGDMVLTHNKRYCRVNETMSRVYEGKLNIIEGYNFKQIICTENHKFLTNNGWKQAKDITSDDYIKYMSCKNAGSPYTIDLSKYIEETELKNIDESEGKIRIKTKFRIKDNIPGTRYGTYINRYVKVDNEVLYLCGRWLGDGSITRRKSQENNSIFQIVFNDREEENADYCINILQEKFGILINKYKNPNQHTVIIRCDNEILCEFFHKEFGKYSGNKVILNYQLKDMSSNLSWVLGLLDSDGLVTSEGQIRLSLKNEKLLKQVKECLRLNNFPSSEIKRIVNNKSFYIYKLEIPKFASLKIIPRLRKIYNDNRMGVHECGGFKSLYINNELYVRVKENTTIDTNQLGTSIIVFNLSVEEDNSYVVNDVIAHNCYVIDSPSDSIESIFDCAKKLARTYSYGGGCGIDISKLAPRGAKVRNAAKETSGSVSFMDLFSMVTGLIGQNGRRGALMISISCDHPDLEEFIEIKSDLNKITKANISVRATDKFMRAARYKEPVKLTFTREETGEVIEKTVNAYDIFHKICKMNWDYAEPGMLFWDRIENWNLLSCDDEFEYAGVNPCAEEPLPRNGACLLGSINLSEFVKSNGLFDFEDFSKSVRIAVRALNEILDEGIPLHPLKEQRETARDWRQIGLGIFGLADALIKMGITYGSTEAIDVCDLIGLTMANSAIDESAILASEEEPYPNYKRDAVTQSAYYSVNALGKTKDHVNKYGLRNSQLLTIAPTGSLSTMLGVSGGIEPIFANYYTRKTESLKGHDEYYKVYTPIVKQYMSEHYITDDKDLPEFFVTAQTLDYEDRIAMQGIWQKHIDASISSTVNVPNDFTVEEVENLYMDAWLKGLKGVTIFRDGCKRAGILTTTPKKKEETKNEVKDEVKDSNNTNGTTTLSRGMIIKADDNCIGRKRTLTTGCGSLHCEAFFDPDTGALLETYLSKGSQGGCQCFMVGLSRMISLAARGGVDIYSIVDQLKSSGTCPSYAVRTATKHDTSKGSSCPVSVGNALIEMYNELQKELNEDEEIIPSVKKTVVPKTPQPPKKKTFETIKPKCPECGEMVNFEGGCMTCPNCGWTKCD